MDTSDNLDLPYIMPSQAQKHVTHNEAIGALDALVQLSVLDRNLAAPPLSPANGDRYIVAAAASGAWIGKTGQIAHRLDGAWTFHAPRVGWLAYVADEASLVYWTGSAWSDYAAAIATLQNLALLGVGTTANGANPFSAKLNKALWTAKTAAEGGDGDLRYTLNKEAAADVLSFLLQTGFSGRAEIGLIGDDNLSLKVSPDGASWTTALTVDRANGNVAVQGAANAFAIHGSMQIGGVAVSTRYATVNNYGQITCRYDNNGASVHFAGQNYSITGVNQGSRCEFFFGAGGALGARAGALDILSTADWAVAGNRSAKFSVSLANAGAFAERFAVQADGALQINAATVVDGNRIVRLRAYTNGTLPPAATAAGQAIQCSDLGGGSGQLVSDGTAWRRSSPGHQTVSTDANLTLTTLTSAESQRHTGTLTANRTVTLSTAGAYAGATFCVTRTGGGAFTLDVGGLKALATNSWARVAFDGAAWFLAQYGTL